MKRFFSIILVISIVGISVNASHAAQYWSKTYGGSDYDLASSIQQTQDGGISWRVILILLVLVVLISGYLRLTVVAMSPGRRHIEEVRVIM